MSISQQAMADQQGSGYAVDAWIDLTVEPILKLWQGVGGHSNFFFSEEDARVATGAYEGSKAFKFAETLWRLAQVAPNSNPALGYRQAIAEFVVDIPTPAAVGLCTANRTLGSGSVFQYYIPNWEGRLYQTGRTFKFGSKSY